MAVTHNLIASYTVPSNTAGYTFSSIPASYTDLKLMWSMRLASGSTTLITFNGVTSGYQYRSFFNVGNTGGSADTYGNNFLRFRFNIFSILEIYLILVLCILQTMHLLHPNQFGLITLAQIQQAQAITLMFQCHITGAIQQQSLA